MTTDIRRRGNQLWVAVGLIIAVAAFALAYFLSRAAPPVQTITPVPANGAVVVVARVAIAPGTLVTPAMLQETRIKGALPANAFTSCQQMLGQPCVSTFSAASPPPNGSSTVTTAAQGANYYAVVAISPNTVITADLVATNRTFQPASFGSLTIPPGEVAIAIPITGQQAVAGYLQPGDYVDIIVAGKKPSNLTAFAYQDLEVLRIGAPVVQTPAAKGSAPPPPASSASGGEAVLAVTRAQALGITELEQNNLIYTLALRSTADYNTGYIPSILTPADQAAGSCVAGATINPIVQADLQQAQQTETAASTQFTKTQQQVATATTAYQQYAGQPTSTKGQTAQAALNAATVNLAQAQFAVIQAHQQVLADAAVLYCGAQAARNHSSSKAGFVYGDSKMMQALFGFGIPSG